MKQNFNSFESRVTPGKDSNASSFEEHTPGQENSLPQIRNKETFSEEEIGEAKQKIDRLLQRYQGLLVTFAKDNSLQFKAGDGFRINLETGVVLNDVRWFLEKGFSENQILWAHLHEITHFRDLADDRSGMEARMEHMVTRSQALGAVMMQKWVQAAGEDHPAIEQLRRKQPLGIKRPALLNSTELAAFKIHHTFYNVLDDIWVNNSVAQRAPRYASRTAVGKEVEDLYREKLFAETDYQGLPRHMQFLYALLREEMVPGEQVQVSSEVTQALNRPVLYKGKTYLARDLVDTFIKPRYRRNTNVTSRFEVTRECLEPVFDELLARDIEDWEPNVPDDENPHHGTENKNGGGANEESGSGDPENSTSESEASPSEAGTVSGNPFEAAYDEFDRNTPDQLDDEEVEAYVDHVASVAKEQQPQKNEDAERLQATLDEQWLEKNDISPETWEAFRLHEQEVQPYLAELSKLWRHIVYGSSTHTQQRMQGHFNTGTELDVQRVVDEFPLIERGEMFRSRIMKRMMPGEKTIEQPDLIRVRLLGDVSASMLSDNKMQTLRRCYVLLLSSLNEFNTYLELTRSVTGSTLKVDTEARSFGIQTRVIKPLESTGRELDKRATAVRSFDALLKARGEGSTRDHLAFEAILSSLTPEDKKSIADKKVLELIIEITDGGSDSEHSTRRAIDELRDTGAVIRGFQIGRPDQDERRKFEYVWNQGRNQREGEFIGSDLGNMVPALANLLREYLGNVHV